MGVLIWKKTIICIIFILILTGCTQKIPEWTIYDDLTEAGYILEDMSIPDLGFDETLISAKSISDTLSDDHGIIYEVSANDAELFFQNRIDYSYNANDIVFIYKVENYVLEMYHSTTSTFPGFMRHYEFETNDQYYLYFTSETEEESFFDELTDAGYLLEDISISVMVFWCNIHFRKIHQRSVKWRLWNHLWSGQRRYKFIFIKTGKTIVTMWTTLFLSIKVENYVLEMYHSTTSTFPGFMRHYDFEANFQYKLFYSGEVEYHPLIQMMLDNGGYIFPRRNQRIYCRVSRSL